MFQFHFIQLSLKLILFEYVQTQSSFLIKYVKLKKYIYSRKDVTSKLYLKQRKGVFKLSLDESTDSIIISKEEAFVQDFLTLWKEVLNYVRLELNMKIFWQNYIQIAKEVFQKFILPFYSKWEHLGYLSYIEAYITKFSSVLITIEDVRILFPRKLIQFESNQSSSNIYEKLSKNPSLEGMKISLMELSSDLNYSIRKTDYKIIQKIGNPNFSKSLDRFPKQKELAYGTRQDIRTINSRMGFLIQNSILSMIYLVDLARIGYQTLEISHGTPLRDFPSSVTKYIAYHFPTLGLDQFSTVIRFPYLSSEVLIELKKLLKITDSNITQLCTQYRGWNLSGLDTNPSNRWKIKPPLLEIGGSWQKDLISGNTHFRSNLDPFFDVYNITYEEARLLGYIHLHSTMEDKHLESQLNRSRSAILRDWKNMLRSGLIYRFPIFSNIGLNCWIYFLIRNLRKNDLRLIHQHLKFFPYSMVEVNESKGFIIGHVNIPSDWVYVFLHRLSSIKYDFPECTSTYYLGPEIFAHWGLNILETFNWDRYR